jgi:hypothetical protein
MILNIATMRASANRRNYPMITRSELITQLRFALGELTSPNNDVVEFEIGDTEFCFEFEQEE